MKSLATSLFCLLFALVAQTAQSAKIDGGVVASNGKQIFYYNFETGKSERVAGHLENAVIKPPFAVSENGKTLLWMTDEGKMHTCLLPLGTEYMVRGDHIRIKGEVKLRDHDFEMFSDFQFDNLLSQRLPNQNMVPLHQKVVNFTISPLGTKFSFEAEMKGNEGWTLVPPGHPLDRAWMAQNSRSGFAQESINLPMWALCEPGNFQGVMVSMIGSDRFLKRCFRCGNSCEYPTVTKFRPTTILPPGAGGVISMQMPTPVILGGHISWPIEECCKRFSYRRDARFTAWSKDDQMLAVVYQTAPNVWGPIEIRSFEAWQQEHIADFRKNRAKPGVYEIDIRFRTFEGLAWAPDGSLTFRTEGKVYKIEKNQIDQGIANSKMVTVKGDLYQRNCEKVVVDNVFRVNPVKVPTYNVSGTKMCWVSNSAFIIRGDDGGLYLHDIQDGGGPEKLLPKIPEDFFYCKLSLPSDEMVKSVSSEYSGTDYVEVRSGIDKLQERFHGDSTARNPTNLIGEIKIIWETAGTAHGGERMVNIWASPPPSKDKRVNVKMDAARPEIKSLDEIKDPADYQYQPQKLPNNWVGGVVINMLGKDDVIIYKNGDSFSAMQVMSFDEESMEYRWKYWRKPSKDKKTPQKGGLTKTSLKK